MQNFFNVKCAHETHEIHNRSNDFVSQASKYNKKHSRNSINIQITTKAKAVSQGSNIATNKSF